MKQQILIIGGGTTFNSHEEYLHYLKTRDLDLERLKARNDWKNSLGNELGENFDVFVPKMPNVANARFEEWKIWFERTLFALDDNAVLIGHSMGGIFLAKYLSQHASQKKIKATILIAAPFDDETQEPLAEFKIDASLKNFSEQAGRVCLIQSRDDSVVPFGELDKYKKEIPEANILVFEDRGHFKQESFPELADLIKSL